MSKVIFVSEICASENKTTSTHILTGGLLDGIVADGNAVVFVAICEKSEEAFVRKVYSDRVSSIVFVEKRFMPDFNKYKHLIELYKYTYFGYGLDSDIFSKIDLRADSDTILISHSPSLEALCVCRTFLMHCPGLRYIQYWSDPLALTGILPEQMNVKRLPFRIIENYWLSKAKDIVYGTGTLRDFQAELYPKHASRMRYIDLPYIPKRAEKSERTATDTVCKLLYSGNYFSRIRNILPLYNAMDNVGDRAALSIYGSSELSLDNKPNVFVHGRVSAEEIQSIELEADVIVCILNKECIQIPGKVFYNADINQHILIIVDGKYGNTIRRYLEKFGRFTFCENNEASIAEAVEKILKDPKVDNIASLEMLAPKKIASELLGGIDRS